MHGKEVESTHLCILETIDGGTPRDGNMRGQHALMTCRCRGSRTVSLKTNVPGLDPQDRGCVAVPESHDAAALRSPGTWMQSTHQLIT